MRGLEWGRALGILAVLVEALPTDARVRAPRSGSTWREAMRGARRRDLRAPCLPRTLPSQSTCSQPTPRTANTVITAATAVVVVGRTSNSRLCRSLLIVVGWPIFKERQWPSFRGAQTARRNRGNRHQWWPRRSVASSCPRIGNQVQARDDQQRARGGEPDPPLP